MTETVDKGPYAHFMQKEIFEQPMAAKNALNGLTSIHELTPAFFGAKGEDIFNKIDGILILACGTSYHAGQLARYWLETIANIPTTVEIANEYRYKTSVFRPNHLVIAISQSGGTSDTVAAVEKAKSMGYEHLLSICNVEDSTLMKMADLTFPTRAGAEIGIASTKAFIAQLVGLYLVTLLLAKQRKTVDMNTLSAGFEKLLKLPDALEETLKVEPTIKQWAQVFKDKTDALFIGRGLDYPIALEGALKLKETSYIHSEAFPAGEFRHGPMALIDDQIPVIALAAKNDLLDSIKTIIKEITDKSGHVFVVADKETAFTETAQLKVVEVPTLCPMLAPILHVVPLQLLAYHTTVAKGNDVDQPRNLVKEVVAE